MPAKNTENTSSRILLPIMPTATAFKTGAAFREAVSYTKNTPIPRRMTGKQARARYRSAAPPQLNLEKIERVEKEEARLWRNKDMADKKDEARLMRKKNKNIRDLKPKFHKVEEGQILFTEALKVQITKAAERPVPVRKEMCTKRPALGEVDINVIGKTSEKKPGLRLSDADATRTASAKRKRDDEGGPRDQSKGEKQVKKPKKTISVQRYTKSGGMRPGALDQFLLPKAA